MIRRRPGIRYRILGFDELQMNSHSQAARWAAKEALMKATGVNLYGKWAECQIQNAADGRPYFVFSKNLDAELSRLGVIKSSIQVSLTHESEYAVAVVIASMRS